MLEHPGAARIPGIGQHEAALLVKGAKDGTLFGRSGHWHLISG
jgi:hypothetical protein